MRADIAIWNQFRACDVVYRCITVPRFKTNIIYIFFYSTRFSMYILYPGDVPEPSSSVQFHINERINRVS